jgi:hypothetical protein
LIFRRINAVFDNELIVSNYIISTSFSNPLLHNTKQNTNNMASQILTREFVYTGEGIIPHCVPHVKFALSVRKVEGVALLHCRTYLRLVVLNEGIQTIGFGTFHRCSLLESIIFPSTIISIGESAFQECSSKGSSGNLLAIFSLGKK